MPKSDHKSRNSYVSNRHERVDDRVCSKRAEHKISDASTVESVSRKRHSSRGRSFERDYENYSRRGNRDSSFMKKHSRRTFAYNSLQKEFKDDDYSRNDPKNDSSRKEASRSRSRSKEPTEDYSRQRDRSRERERQRRRKQMESVRLTRGTEHSVFWDGFQWVSRSEAPTSGVFDQHMNATRQMRQVKVANLPPCNKVNCEDTFRIFLTNEMFAAGRTVTAYPVVHVWFDAAEGTGLVELATMEEADVVLSMNGILWGGRNLKLSRPDDVQLITPFIPQKKVLASPKKQPQAATVLPSTSRVVRLEQPLQSPPTIEEDWEELIEDLIEGVESCGGVFATLEVNQSNCDDLPFANLGDVFLEFDTEEAAETCCKLLNGKIYDGKPLKIHRIAMALWNAIGGKKRRDM